MCGDRCRCGEPVATRACFTGNRPSSISFWKKRAIPTRWESYFGQLVPGGENSPRIWREPVALIDVVRAAIIQTDDLGWSHLLAELTENAVRFSPPETRIRMRTQRCLQPRRRPRRTRIVTDDIGGGPAGYRRPALGRGCGRPPGGSHKPIWLPNYAGPSLLVRSPAPNAVSWPGPAQQRLTSERPRGSVARR